jgi:tetratricopeptide (TPR) repeat protein
LKAPRAAALLGLLAALAADPAPARDPRWVGAPPERAASPAERERLVRLRLENGRALRREGRLELAAAALESGLALAPGDAALWRELARVRDAQGRAGEARQARERADAIEPPEPPPPDAPLELPAQGLLVVLLPPLPQESAERSPQDWPEGEAARTLEERLRVRLPQARVVHADFESAAAARAWLAARAPRALLSLRVERIRCGDTVKDGRFGLAWLRAAAERAGAPAGAPFAGRSLVVEPRLPSGCAGEATARALEQVLAAPALREALAGPHGAGFSNAALRSLFPGLGERIEAALEEGRLHVAQGRLAEGVAAFRRAARVDPKDPAAQSYLREAEATLALSRELSRRRGGDEGASLDPRLSPAQRAALEAQLAEERRRREELLAALAVLEEDVRLPPAQALAALRPSEIADAQAFGASLARRRAGGAVSARSAHAPDGAVIARYYFPAGEQLPVLREEDLDRDGRPDRWIAYAGAARAEIFEAEGGAERPDRRFVFLGEGERVARIEIDRDTDGTPERILHFAGDAPSSDARDTDADGVLDTFDRLDAQGHVVLREQDLDADGAIDARSHYEQGRLVRRELLDAGAETTPE